MMELRGERLAACRANWCLLLRWSLVWVFMRHCVGRHATLTRWSMNRACLALRPLQHLTNFFILRGHLARLVTLGGPRASAWERLLSEAVEEVHREPHRLPEVVEEAANGTTLELLQRRRRAW